MTKEPVDRFFGVPMSEWIARIPNELDVDAIGLWQIIPVGMDSFGLEGQLLDVFAARSIVALLENGAVPVRAFPGADGWIPDLSYRGTTEEIAKQIVLEWRNLGINSDLDGLWFSKLKT
ncbi:hypothetical protein [Achromobacter sp.]|uniref:hypothetical protein n=1 Tax=Achromobacter sp. TaxID=134375 RepID=UPI0028A58565|nr:hypothetical protein [Achromobacter sp.]